MSAFNKNYSTTMSKVVKPYCKVCHDAGKLESEYTNHFVKSEPGPMGVVICPTLLNQKCRFCDKLGHTVSRCPDIANINKKQEIIQKREQKEFKKKEFIKTVEKPNNKLVKNCNSKFSALEEEEEKSAPLVIVVDEFPSLSVRPPSPSYPPPPLVSWATIASAPPAKPVLKRQPVSHVNVLSEKKRWADDWSSEEDTYNAYDEEDDTNDW